MENPENSNTLAEIYACYENRLQPEMPPGPAEIFSSEKRTMLTNDIRMLFSCSDQIVSKAVHPEQAIHVAMGQTEEQLDQNEWQYDENLDEYTCPLISADDPLFSDPEFSEGRDYFLTAQARVHSRHGLAFEDEGETLQTPELFMDFTVNNQSTGDEMACFSIAFKENNVIDIYLRAMDPPYKGKGIEEAMFDAIEMLAQQTANLDAGHTYRTRVRTPRPEEVVFVEERGYEPERFDDDPLDDLSEQERRLAKLKGGDTSLFLGYPFDEDYAPDNADGYYCFEGDIKNRSPESQQRYVDTLADPEGDAYCVLLTKEFNKKNITEDLDALRRSYGETMRRIAEARDQAFQSAPAAVTSV